MSGPKPRIIGDTSSHIAGVGDLEITPNPPPAPRRSRLSALEEENAVLGELVTKVAEAGGVSSQKVDELRSGIEQARLSRRSR